MENSIKYVQVIYIAKWIDRKYMMFPFAIYYLLLGVARWPEYFNRIN